MTTTRKLLITKNYNDMILQLEPYLSSTIFPSIDETIDVCDLLFFFNLSFSGSIDSDYTEPLKDLLYCHNVSVDDKTFDKIYKIVLPFIISLKKLS